MKCFVTGGTGTVGVPLLKALRAAGHDVTILCSREQSAAEARKLGATAVVGDMRQPDGWKAHVGNAEAILHCAQITPKRLSASAQKMMADADSACVNALLDAAPPGLKAFIYTSGIFVYGDTPGAPKTEGDAPTPFRMITYKVENERKVLEATAAKGVPGIILRPGLVYGPRGMFADLYLKPASKGKGPKHPGSGQQYVTPIHEDDLAQAYVKVLEKPIAGAVYNVGDDEPVTLGALVTATSEAMGGKKPGGLPPFVLKIVLGGMLVEALLGHQRMTSDKLKNELGWKPLYPTYREGLPVVAAAYKS